MQRSDPLPLTSRARPRARADVAPEDLERAKRAATSLPRVTARLERARASDPEVPSRPRAPSSTSPQAHPLRHRQPESRWKAATRSWGTGEVGVGTPGGASVTASGDVGEAMAALNPCPVRDGPLRAKLPRARSLSRPTPKRRALVPRSGTVRPHSGLRALFSGPFSTDLGQQTWRGRPRRGAASPRALCPSPGRP
jgi:hypothetical protein